MAAPQHPDPPPTRPGDSVTEWTRCRACRRELKDPESRSLGYGPECARKRGLAPVKARRTRPTHRPANVPPAPDALPGQDALQLFYFEPTLDSL
ncbi:DUF6011 domain-containing protein [Streptomyces sp. NPDC056112]|uniref:DUF6011 domain-containing protein n=1 Tax=Streptomyces sp. NPDC056112 TaxID=3345715 RepID=UPI0035D98CB1